LADDQSGAIGDRLALLLADLTEADTAIARAQLAELDAARCAVRRELAELMAAAPGDALDRHIVSAGLRRRLRALDEAEDAVRRQLRSLRRRLGQHRGLGETGSLWDVE
jgi:hypothetical protein